ncbi:MAG: hypothetical protein V4722_21365 [Bacteroidota bacterium]
MDIHFFLEKDIHKKPAITESTSDNSTATLAVACTAASLKASVVINIDMVKPRPVSRR